MLVGDSTTVNLYKLLVAAAAARPDRDVLVCTADDFPTDRYVVAGVAEARGMAVRELPADIDEGLDPAELAAALDDRVAVVVLSPSPTGRARWPTWPPSPGRCTRPARSCCGTSRTRPARCRRSWRRPGPTSPSAARTST